MAFIVCKYLDCIGLIRFRLERAAHAGGLSVRRGQAEHGIVLIIVGTRNKTHMIECDAIATEIDVWLLVGEDEVAKDGIIRAERHRHTRCRH